MKLPHQAFVELNDDLVHNFYEVTNINKWQGHLLLAVDGSVTQLLVSEELLQHFAKAHSQTKIPCVRLYRLCDVKITSR